MSKMGAKWLQMCLFSHRSSRLSTRRRQSRCSPSSAQHGEHVACAFCFRRDPPQVKALAYSSPPWKSAQQSAGTGHRGGTSQGGTLHSGTVSFGPVLAEYHTTDHRPTPCPPLLVLARARARPTPWAGTLLARGSIDNLLSTVESLLSAASTHQVALALAVCSSSE